MLLAAIVSALVFLVAGVFLWLAAVANQSDIEVNFPEYAGRIYRPAHQVATRQGGPVRAWALVTLAPPNPRYPAVLQLRVLALLLIVSAGLAVALWLFS